MANHAAQFTAPDCILAQLGDQPDERGSGAEIRNTAIPASAGVAGHLSARAPALRGSVQDLPAQMIS